MTAIGADEHRARAYLRHLGAAPIGHPVPPRTAMTDRPITPTRVIPASTHLPARPPAPDELPPWREPPAAPPAEPPPPAAPRTVAAEQPQPLVVHVHIDTPEPEPEPEPTRWERLTAGAHRIGRPWQMAAALALTVAPIPGSGYSAATTWHYCVSQTRDGFGIGYGYALAGIPLALAVTAITRNGGNVPRLVALAITTVGLFGAMSWYDPITALTGVTR